MDGESGGQRVTVAAYMKRKYGVVIKNDRVPLLLVKTAKGKGGNPTWIVPELCR